MTIYIESVGGQVKKPEAERLTILLVEDSDAEAVLFAAMLRLSEAPKMDITVRRDLASGAAHLQAGAPDAVLLDLHLPDAVGEDALRGIRAVDPDVPVIVLTAHADERFARQAMASGAQDYILKDRASPDVLRRAITYAVERQHHASAVAAAQERFRVAFDHAPIGIVLLDAAGSIVAGNRALSDMFGCPVHGLLGQSVISLMHPDDARLPPPMIEHLRQHDTAVRIERRILRPDATERWVRATIARVPPPGGGDDRGADQYIAQLEDISALKNVERMVASEAIHDGLTQLPNRALLFDRIAIALGRSARTHHQVAVLFVDLDRFKAVNDSLGHHAGDAVLQAVAKRISAAVRPPDTVARIGGDEFIVLCDGIQDEREARAIAARIESTIAEPVSVDGGEVLITASIGIVVAGDERSGDHRQAEELVRDADTAMYRAKTLGRARWEMFDEHLRIRATQRLRAEVALRDALRTDRLRVGYQPIVDLRSRHVVGAEALLRYVEDDGGLTLPEEFVPVAEESGMINEIGRWVMGEACAEAAQWRAHGGRMRLSVNLSAHQAARPDLMQVVERSIVEAGISPETLHLEITETAVLAAAHSTIKSLEALREQGVRIGIDDFGTGYSALAQLTQFPVDFVKIDRSFVARMGDNAPARAVVAAVIGLASVLGIDAIAEGVEQEHEAALLMELGCEMAQGFLFSPAVPAPDFHDLLD